MSLVLTEKFKINGKPVFAPDENVQISWSDIDSAESGRDEAGNQHRIVIRYDVASITFTYSNISEAELAYMRSIFPKEPDFLFEYPDPTDSEKVRKVRAYRHKQSILWKNAATGQYRNYKFTITESGEGEDDSV
jgi:hypothetical protein